MLAAKTVSAVITGLVSAVCAAVLLITMLVAMNGYSESDATWGLATFVILALVITGCCGAAAFLFCGALFNRQFKPVFAILISMPVFSVLAFIFQVIAAFAGIAVAEYVRLHY